VPKAIADSEIFRHIGHDGEYEEYSKNKNYALGPRVGAFEVSVNGNVSIISFIYNKYNYNNNYYK